MFIRAAPSLPPKQRTSFCLVAVKIIWAGDLISKIALCLDPSVYVRLDVSG